MRVRKPGDQAWCRIEIMTPGHMLWIELNYGKYVQPDGPKPFDWWPELPEKRRQQYEAAALVMMAKGAEAAKS